MYIFWKKHFVRYLLISGALVGLAGCLISHDPQVSSELSFESLVLSHHSNEYLVCPLDLCMLSVPHRVSPAYPMSAEALKHTWLSIVGQASRMETLYHNDFELTHIHRSPIFKFPDIISVRFVSAGDRSTLAVYSRSVYGYFDFGINRRRTDGWLAEIQPHVSDVE